MRGSREFIKMLKIPETNFIKLKNITKCRSKQKEIEAIQWTGDNFEEIKIFFGKYKIEQSKNIFNNYSLEFKDNNGYNRSVYKYQYIVKDKDNNFFVYDMHYFETHYIPEDKWEEIDDGYHTFKELYEYRKLYNAVFFNSLPPDKFKVLKSKCHADGEECFGGGWFVVQAELPTGQISNHYEMKDWDLFKIPEKEFANEWDGHSPADVAKRIKEYILNEK